MRKLSVFILGTVSALTFAIGGYKKEAAVTAKAEGVSVYVGGMSAGFTLKAGGVQIVGTCEVLSDTGVSSPASKAGLKAGDKIVKAAGIKIETIDELNDIVNKLQGKTIVLDIIRNKEQIKISVVPVCDKTTKRYKIGILARDSVSGIGTVTYIDGNTRRFGALGHTVLGENKQELKISDGVVYECSILSISKGVRGKAGELRGMFLNNKMLGNAEKLCTCGIFGEISVEYRLNELQKAIADSADAMPGNAYIYSTINGVLPVKYEIEIVKVDKNNKENKNYVIKVTDDKLLSETGGIVQGMSGSPILQNGKLIGAVTHVFLNDPTRGYGIDIETMLQQ